MCSVHIILQHADVTYVGKKSYCVDLELNCCTPVSVSLYHHEHLIRQ